MQDIQSEDQKVVFDSIRPMADELWNFIDGTRTVERIAENVSIEFGFRLSPAQFLPLFDGMERIGLINAGKD